LEAEEGRPLRMANPRVHKKWLKSLLRII